VYVCVYVCACACGCVWVRVGEVCADISTNPTNLLGFCVVNSFHPIFLCVHG